MDIQIRYQADTGEITPITGEEELNMELSMGLTVECLETNSGEIYLVEIQNGKKVAYPANETAEPK